MTRPTLWDAMSTPWVPPQQADGDEYDVVVAGAGVVGLSTAIELAGRGMEVVVVEALDAVGQGTTARSTGKLSLLQGTRLSSIESSHGPAVARGYLDTCRAGLEWVEGLLDAWDVTTQRELAGTWAAQESQVAAVRSEDAAARRAGRSAHLASARKIAACGPGCRQPTPTSRPRGFSSAPTSTSARPSPSSSG